jgi:hypothetical protein
LREIQAQSLEKDLRTVTIPGRHGGIQGVEDFLDLGRSRSEKEAAVLLVKVHDATTGEPHLGAFTAGIKPELLPPRDGGSNSLLPRRKAPGIGFG